MNLIAYNEEPNKANVRRAIDSRSGDEVMRRPRDEQPLEAKPRAVKYINMISLPYLVINKKLHARSTRIWNFVHSTES